jgi:hypothetical protein
LIISGDSNHRDRTASTCSFLPPTIKRYVFIACKNKQLKDKKRRVLRFICLFFNMLLSGLNRLFLNKKKYMTKINGKLKKMV